jgi:hypothetical protein
MKQKPTDYRNRIKALEYVNSADLVAHPGNWREHPQAQADAMRGVLAEVGIAGALLAYRSERQGGALVVIDGHLRKDAAPQQWPVLILDVDDAEADYLLAVVDPLAAMATADAGALDALLSSVQSGEAGVQAMLAELAAHSGLYDAGDTPHLDDLADEYGDPGERDFWPFIRVQVSPDTFRRWRSLMDGLPGEDEANKAAQILEAVDVTVLSRGDATNP